MTDREREREGGRERERERDSDIKTLQTHIHMETRHLHAPENVQPSLFLALSIQEFVHQS
jgi:hypothetical protein